MTVIAERQLLGSYGLVRAGERFQAPDDIARELLSRGLVRHADPPRIAYEVRGGKFIPGPDWPAIESEKKEETNGKRESDF